MIWRVVKFSLQNLMRCIFFKSKSGTLEIVFWEIWLEYCFSGSDWVLVSTVNVNINLLKGREVEGNVSYRFSCQICNWNVAHVNLPPNLWSTAWWQQTIFRKAMDKTLWRKNSSRSAVFPKIYLCENHTKSILVSFLSIFSNVFVRATRRKAMAENWHLHRIFAKLAAGRYHVTYHNLDINKSWRCLIENQLSRHVWLKNYLRYPLSPGTYYSFSFFVVLNLPYFINARTSQLQTCFTVFFVHIDRLYTLS